MNKEQYLAKRKGLMDAAQQLVDTEKMEEFESKVKEIEALDNQYDDYCKAQANLRALEGKVAVHPVNAFQTATKESVSFEAKEIDPEDMTNSMDYRRAFMAHVMKGEAMPAKFRAANANTKTTDVGELIPTIVIEKVIEKMESVGTILPLVTQVAYKGGVKIPTSTVKPVATWVSEGAGSDRQKKTIGAISFTYHKLRCAVSISLEVGVMALPVFETVLVNNIAEAMTKAIEQAIVSGSGTGQPKGFLNETPASGHAIEIAATDDLDYEVLVEAEAALEPAYENEAVWFMSKKSFMAFVGMTDTDGQPIARVNYGIGGKPERMLLGRAVVVNDYMDSYAGTVKKDTIFAAIFNPKDYVLNASYSLTIKRYEDNDTDDTVTKAIMLVDGKAVDINSLVTVTKKAASA